MSTTHRSGRMSGRLRTKFIILLILVAIVPLGLLAWHTDVTLRRQFWREVEERGKLRAVHRVESLDAWVEDKIDGAQQVARLPSARALLSERQRAPDPRLVQIFHHVLSAGDAAAVALADGHGRIVFATPPTLEGESVGGYAFFSAVREGKPILSPVLVVLPLGEPCVLAAAPIFAPETGRILGATLLFVPTARLREQIALDTSVVAPGSFDALVDENLIRIAQPSKPSLELVPLVPLPDSISTPLISERRFGPETQQRLAQATNVTSCAEAARYVLAHPNAIRLTRSWLPSNQRYNRVIAARVKRAPWVYLLAIPEAEAAAQVASVRYGALTLSAFAAMVALFIGFYGARRLTEPLTRLMAAANRLAQGDLSARTGLPEGSGELSRLARAFDEMATALQQRNAERDRAAAMLHESEQRYRTLVELSPDAIAVHSEGKIVFLNAAGAKLVGAANPQELIGTPVMNYVHPDSKEVAAARIRQIMETGKAVPAIEEKFIRVDGSPVDVEVSATPITYGGKPAVQMIAHDITQRKRAEEKLLHLNRLYTVLSEINQAIVRIGEREQLFQEVCRIAVETGLFRMAWIGLMDSEMRLVRPVAHRGLEDGYLDKIRTSIADEPEGRGPTGSVQTHACLGAIREGKHFICNDIQNDSRMLPWREEATTRGYRSSAAFPIQLHAHVIGTLNLYASEPNFFDEDEVKLLNEVVTDISFALEKMEQEASARRAEEALRRSEQLFRRVWQDSLDGMRLTDENGTILMVNDAFCRMVEKTREELLGKHYSVIYSAEHHQQMIEKQKERFATRTIEPHFERKLRLWNGREVWFELSNSFLDIEGQPPALLSIIRDITERKRVEDALQQAERKYRSIFENAIEGLYQSTPDGHFLTVNPALVRMLGYSSPEELMQVDIATTLYSDPSDRQRFQQILAERGEVRDFRLRLRTRDGRLVDVSENARLIRDTQGNPLYYEGILEDITERKRLEAQLLQAQKMESIGVLAGGIAHDFNNLLTGILGHADLALLDLPEESPLRNDLQQIRLLGRRAANLISQLLTFSRRAVTNKQPLELVPIIKETAKLLQRTLPETITVTVTLADDLKIVEADVTQMQQILTNLCVNARDAMPEGGELEISASNVTIDEEYCRRYTYARPGEYVCLSVRDTGIGMPPEIRERIFEPFFTTKEPGRGTGLGLAIVYGIVKAHGGFLNVYSEVGHGSEFKIYLPATRLGPAAIEPTVVDVPKGNETILLVEDDATVRELGATLLEKLGYRVLTARDGEEGIEIFRAHHQEIAAVLSDMVMPKMGGVALVRAFKEIDPNVRLLLMSGYLIETDRETLKALGVTASVQKPLTLTNLAKQLRTVLDEKQELVAENNTGRTSE